MNEALNPSRLEYLQYIVVQDALQNRCTSWQEKYPRLELLKQKLVRLTSWNGDDYGFDAENTISIVARCFDSN